jgi:hypothetical protein
MLGAVSGPKKPEKLPFLVPATAEGNIKDLNDHQVRRVAGARTGNLLDLKEASQTRHPNHTPMRYSFFF